jgi:hypothetical protein
LTTIVFDIQNYYDYAGLVGFWYYGPNDIVCYMEIESESAGSANFKISDPYETCDSKHTGSTVSVKQNTTGDSSTMTILKTGEVFTLYEDFNMILGDVVDGVEDKYSDYVDKSELDSLLESNSALKDLLD